MRNEDTVLFLENRSMGWTAMPEGAPEWAVKRILEIRRAQLAGRETRSITATPATRGPYLFVDFRKAEQRTTPKEQRTAPKTKPSLTTDERKQLASLRARVEADVVTRRKNLLNSIL